MKGAFIVLDGLDGSGKATQARLLAERLQAEGRKAEKIDFPHYDGNFFGAFIGECLAGKHGDFVHLDPKIASTLYACDRKESAPSIERALQEGTMVIADRFTSANQIHQGGKIADESEREAFLAWLERMEHEVLGIPRPDRVIYLRVPIETSLALLSQERAKKNGAQDGAMDTVESDRKYIEQSFASAEYLAERNPSWKAIDCTEAGTIRTREAIHEEVWKLVQEILPEL